MYYESLLEEIERGEVSQIYLFQGEEEYLKTEVLAKIKKFIFQNPDAENFNFRIYYGQDLDYQDFFEEANTYPILSKRKLLIVKEGDRLNRISANKISETLLTLPPFTHLIFFFHKIDKRQKLPQIIQKKGRYVNFYPLKDRTLRVWVASQFKKRKQKIDEEALSFLLTRAGDRLQDLEKEIEKISLYAGGRTRVEINDLEASAEYQNQTVYDLIDKITEKETEESLKILSELMKSRKGVELIGLFYWQFSRIFKAKILLTKGVRPEQIGRQVGLPEYYLSNFLNRTNKFSKEELKAVFEKMLQADINLKSTNLAPKLIFELLIINLCATQPPF